ncbi:MAG: hypothetical protein E7255_04550 [Lachnospiraceae bacterium]|nr:hypothetical protein [Lachnospiraceae bacterium]
MVFKFGEKANCIATLEQLNGDTKIDIQYIKFRKASASNIEDILRGGINKNNQVLIIDDIKLSKKDFKKLGSFNYKATFITLVNIGGNTFTSVKFILGNVDLRFESRNVEIDGENIIISLANMIVYPSGDCFFEEMNDE